MHPDTARLIIEAWRNERRPGRTHGARIMDAVMHVRISQKEMAGVEAGPNIGKDSDENSTLSADKNHLAPHL